MTLIARQDLVLGDWSWNTHVQRRERRNFQYSLLFTAVLVLIHGNACNAILVMFSRRWAPMTRVTFPSREEVRHLRLLWKQRRWNVRLLANEDAIIAAVKRELLRGSCNIVRECGPLLSRLHELFLRPIASIITHGAHIYFQMIGLYECSCEWLHYIVDEPLVPTGFENTKRYFPPEGFFSPHNRHVWTRVILKLTSHLPVKYHWYSWYRRTHCREHKSVSWQVDCL